jgi:hypothetical protein
MPFTVAWLVLAAALCALIAVWGVQLTQTLNPTAKQDAAAVPRATAAPGIVRDYTVDGAAGTVSLCSESAPPSATVTIDSATGVVLSTIDCSLDATSVATGCLFTQSSDGTVVVMSNETGSLLTPAQAANCSK